MNNIKKIAILCKWQLEKLPPVMNVARILKSIGQDVTIICLYSNESTKSEFNSLGISIVDITPAHRMQYRSLPEKALLWHRFRTKTWHILDSMQEFDLFWVGSVDTALALGKHLLKKRYVLQALELYDTVPIYRLLIKKYLLFAAAVVVPEACRASIYRTWYGLSRTPIVLPNKPANHPHQLRLNIEDDKARDLLTTIDPAEKIVLYQGHIEPSRELRFVAEGVEAMGKGWTFVLMGGSERNYLETLKKSHMGLVHIPTVDAPRHLHITSHAYIGVVTYSHTCLNNVFCAPNKIWEYSGFALPMLCNDLPPLNHSVQNSGAGLCINTENSSSVIEALKTIDANYQHFSKNALALFNSIDTYEIIKNVLRQASLSS
jgi:hypothetical protein